MSNRFSVVETQIKDAWEMVNIGKGRHALLSCRTGLEILIKQLCKDSGISSSTEELDLFNMIDLLYESTVISEHEKDLMHRTRKICNDIHVDLDNYDVPIDSVKEAIENLEELTNTISQKNLEESTKYAESVNNVPLEYPDYYSSKRRYYGKWAQCKTREQLLVIPEYVDLIRKANQGDVEAMLNIANGFLPREITWNSNKLINMPPYTHKGVKYNNNNAYDARYYSWIIKAVETASIRWERNEYVPMKYIATAIWEACLFIFYFSMPFINNSVSGVNEWKDKETRENRYELIYENQYTVEAVNKDGYNASTFRTITDTCYPFIHYVFNNYKGEIIDQIHTDANIDTLKKIQYMRLCSNALNSECTAIRIKNGEFTEFKNEADDQGYFQYSEGDIEELKSICNLSAADVPNVCDEIRLELFQKVSEECGGGLYNQLYQDASFELRKEESRVAQIESNKREYMLEVELEKRKEKEKIIFGILIAVLVIGFIIACGVSPSLAHSVGEFFEAIIVIAICVFCACAYSGGL